MGVSSVAQRSKFAFARMNTSNYHMELFTSNTDGSSATKVPNQPYDMSSAPTIPSHLGAQQHPPLLPVADLGGAVIDGINVDGSSLVQETNANSYIPVAIGLGDGNTLGW